MRFKIFLHDEDDDGEDDDDDDVVTCEDVMQKGARQQETNVREDENYVIGEPMSPGGRQVTSRVVQTSAGDTMTQTAHEPTSRTRNIRSGLLSFREFPCMLHIHTTLLLLDPPCGYSKVDFTVESIGEPKIGRRRLSRVGPTGMDARRTVYETQLSRLF